MLLTAARRRLTTTSAPPPVPRQWFAPSLTSLMNDRIRACRSVAELEALIANNHHLDDTNSSGDLSAASLAAAFSKLGKLVGRGGGRENEEDNAVILPRLRDALYAQCKGVQFQPRQLADICHGVAQSRLDTRIPALVAFDASLDLRAWSPQDITWLVWSFAKLGRENDSPEALLLHVQDELLVRDLRVFNCVHLTNILWSFSMLLTAESGNAERYLPLFSKVADEIVHGRALADLSEHDLSSLLGSFARMGFKHVDLFNAVAKDVTVNRSLNTLTAQGLSTVLWSFASVGVRCDALLDKTSQHLQHTRVARDVGPLAVSQILWSFVTLRRHKAGDKAEEDDDAKLFRFLLDRVMKEKEKSEVSVRLLTRMLHSVGKHAATAASTGTGDWSDFAQFVARRVDRELDSNSISSHDVATLLWSLSACGYHGDSVLFHKLCRHVQLTQIDSQDVSNILWALAHAQHRSSNAFVSELAREMAQQGLAGFSCQAVCNVCWALAQLRVLHDPAVQAFFQLPLPQEPFAIEYFVEHATQLNAARSAWRAAVRSSNKAMPERSLLLDALCAGGWVDAMLPPSRASAS